MNHTQPGLRRRLPYYVAALLFAAGIAGASHADPEWPTHLGLDIWSLDELRAELQGATLKQHRLEVLGAMALQRIKLKDAIIDDLIDHRITLFEAAAAFLELNRGRREVATYFSVSYPGQNEAEATCRNVIEFVSVVLQEDPQHHAEEVGRLTLELESARHADGQFVLP